MLAVFIASGWSCSAFSAEAAAPAEAATPIDAATAPAEAAVAPAEAAVAPAEVAVAPAEVAVAPAEVAVAPVEATDTLATEVAPVDEQASEVRFAPVNVQFGGNIGYVTQHQKIGSSKYTTQSLNTNVNINAESFIWEPWLVQVKGGLGLNANKGTSSAGSGLGTTKTSGNFVTGNAALLLVQSSRFPFEAHVTKSDSRQTSGLGVVSSDYQTTRYGLSQRYRTVAGDSNYMVSYDRNLWESVDTTNRDKQDEWHIETSHQFTSQTLTFSGASTSNVRKPTNESNRVNVLTANHNYRPDTSLSVDTIASIFRTNYQLTQGENGVNYAQLNSIAFWRSDEKPLRLNGGVRVDGLTNTANNFSVVSTTRTRSANANLGVIYDLSRHTHLNADANVNNFYSNNGMQTLTTSESIGVNSVPDLIDFGTFSYNRSVSGNISNQNGGKPGSTQLFTFSPGHGASRDMILNGGVLGMQLNQSLVLDMDNRSQSSLRRAHTGSLGWSLVENQKTTTMRMTVSDTHTMGGTQDYYQLINMQASISENWSRNTSWRGNLTAQKARNGSNTIASSISNAVSADLGYSHMQVFGIPYLNFTSELRMNGSSLAPSTPGVTNPQESISWENRLEHSIGLLQTRLSLRVAEVNNTSQSMLWFSLNRQF
ncbi:MAG: hypothetical protein OEV15_02755 [Gallionella sp.]|nr:hypothetical protein [Gallionella sp.]